MNVQILTVETAIVNLTLEGLKMGIDSIVKETEKVTNTERTFGEVSEQEGYYPFFREKENGEMRPAMLTPHMLDEAEAIAARNMEDMPGEKGFFEKLFKG